MTETATRPIQRQRRHPTPRDYWRIGLILGAITAVEVTIVYIDALDRVVAPLLIGLSAAKFALVALWFMHLRFDRRTYSRLFLVGIIGAVTLFAVVLFSFGLLIGG
ncbi:MAG: cytochrome C oxidase subunit IV family protein [Acidimicrobiia bacterium]